MILIVGTNNLIMLYNTTLYEIETNTNPGVEYEIALFYKLLAQGSSEANQVMTSILLRPDVQKVLDIIAYTDKAILLNTLQSEGLVLKDVSFETQNDRVGPADIVMTVFDCKKGEYKLGLSVKYANRNTLNPTARKFITEEQIRDLQKHFEEITIPAFIKEMRDAFGEAKYWKRRRTEAAHNFYDLVRDAVIENWPNVKNKTLILAQMFHSDSPIPFWVIDYTNHSYSVDTNPCTVDESRADDIVVEKYKNSYVAFLLDGIVIGKVQVKCNNGVIEDQFNHSGKAKRVNPDFLIDGVPKIKGDPFGSWDFTSGA